MQEFNTNLDLIKIFEDTQNVIHNDQFLQNRTMMRQCDAQLYFEDYVSPIRKVKGTGKCEVIENTTFRCAKDLYQPSLKIAVLNFANPREPGGGVWRGAMAQEECLCRCSNLYNILNQPYFLEHYYQYHQYNCDCLFSDRLIYSPNVTFFKTDDSIPSVLEDPFEVDVITCAAPYLHENIKKEDRKLLDIYKSRIKNILEVAISKDVDVLILGAFGCGAFHNDPNLMSEAFADLLIHDQYAVFFEKVVFAIKRTASFCPNLCSFQEAFYGISAEGNKRRFWL